MADARILFLEDEEFIRLIVAEALAEAGLAVTEAASGEAAVALLDEQPGFDLLLADVHVPGRLSGIDVARHARSRWPGMPVVFVTGRPDALHASGLSGLRDRYVLKPYRPTEVLAAIQSSLAP